MWCKIVEFAASRPVHEFADMARPATITAAGISIIGAIIADPFLAWSAAVGAVLTVVISRLIDGYRSILIVRREQRAAESIMDTEKFAAEVQRRIELQMKCEQLVAETGKNRHRIADLQQTIEFMKAQHEALKLGLGKLDDKIQILTTPDPDAPKAIE